MSNHYGNHTNITTILLRLTGDGTLTRKQLADYAGVSLSKVDQVLRGEGHFNHDQFDGLIRMGFELEIDDLRYRYVPEGYSVNHHEEVLDMVNGTIANQMLEADRIKGRVIEQWQNDRVIDSDATGAELARQMEAIWSSVAVEFERRAKAKPLQSTKSA